MTITEISQALRETVRSAALEKFGVELDQVVVEVPPKPEFGDLAFPAGFELAKKIKHALHDLITEPISAFAEGQGP